MHRQPLVTCATGWNDPRRASCTMQNRAIIADYLEKPQAYVHGLRPSPPPTRMVHSKTPITPRAMPPPHYTTTWLIAAALCLVFALPAQAAATPSKSKTPKASTQSTATKPKTVKIRREGSSSEETPAQRERRLLRECKGLPNAGVCRGYTR